MRLDRLYKSMYDIGTKGNPNIVLSEDLCKHNIPSKYTGKLRAEYFRNPERRKTIVVATHMNPPIVPEEGTRQADARIAANAAGKPYHTKDEAAELKRLHLAHKKASERGDLPTRDEISGKIKKLKSDIESATKLGGARETRRLILSTKKPNLP